MSTSGIIKNDAHYIHISLKYTMNRLSSSVQWPAKSTSMITFDDTIPQSIFLQIRYLRVGTNTISHFCNNYTPSVMLVGTDVNLVTIWGNLRNNFFSMAPPLSKTKYKQFYCSAQATSETRIEVKNECIFPQHHYSSLWIVQNNYIDISKIR